MRFRLISAMVFLIMFLTAMGFYLVKGINQKANIEDVLIEQAEIQGLVNNLIVSIENAQLVVFMKQAGYLAENDQIIDEINNFEDYLERLNRKYKIEIDTKNCLTCHVSIDIAMVEIDHRLSAINKLVQEYKMQVSTLFTSLDREIQKKREKEIGEIGNDIIEVTNHIHHITNTMLVELDQVAKRSFRDARKSTMLTLGFGLIVIVLVISYLIFTLTIDVNRFIKRIHLISQSDFTEKIHWDSDREMIPLVDSVNNVIDRIKEREQEIRDFNEELRHKNFRLDELKLTMEDKVRMRTDEINRTNRELIEHQLKLEKTHAELQAKTKELEDNNLRLQELDQMKSDFIQMTNHEIRTPVVTIKGYTEVMLSGNLGNIPDKAMNSLKIMNRSINRLTSIIESTRAYTMLGNKKGQRQLSEMAVGEFLQDIYNDMIILTDKRNQNLVLEVPKNCPHIRCDVVQVYQAMVNLVINSIRYSPDNSDITIGAAYPKNGKEVTFYVKDKGMGIESKELKKIFLPYYEVKSVREHHSGTIEFNSGGTGLGLAIVKKIIDNHKGRVWAESPGSWKGSSFYFTVPLAQTEIDI